MIIIDDKAVEVHKLKFLKAYVDIKNYYFISISAHKTWDNLKPKVEKYSKY